MAAIRVKVMLSTMSACIIRLNYVNLHPINKMLEGSILFSSKYFVFKSIKTGNKI